MDREALQALNLYVFIQWVRLLCYNFGIQTILLLHYEAFEMLQAYSCKLSTKRDKSMQIP